MSVERSPRNPRSAFERSIASAKGGSFSALGQLFDHYRDYLLRVANDEWDSDLGAKVAASDLVQQTFLEATRAFPRFVGSSEPELRMWLRRILVNEILTTRRSFLGTEKRLITREISADNNDLGADVVRTIKWPGPAPEERAEVAEDWSSIEWALCQLPEDYRRVIELRTLSNLSFEEVGANLERSSEAARRLWSRAVQRLATLLDGEGAADV